MTKTQMKVGLAILAAGLLASVTSANAGYRGHHILQFLSQLVCL